MCCRFLGVLNVSPIVGLRERFWPWAVLDNILNWAVEGEYWRRKGRSGAVEEKEVGTRHLPVGGCPLFILYNLPPNLSKEKVWGSRQLLQGLVLKATDLRRSMIRVDKYWFQRNLDLVHGLINTVIGNLCSTPLWRWVDSLACKAACERSVFELSEDGLPAPPMLTVGEAYCWCSIFKSNSMLKGFYQ
jgi:hypothetical protein